MLYGPPSSPARRPFPLHSGTHRRSPPGFGESAPPWAAQVGRRDQAGHVGLSARNSRAFAVDDGPSQRHRRVISEGDRGLQTGGVPSGDPPRPSASSSTQRESAYETLLPKPPSVPAPRRWYHRRPSWSVSSAASSTSSSLSSLGSLSSWSSTRSRFGSLRRAASRSTESAKAVPVLRPEDNLQLYTRRATVGLCPQAPLSPQKSTRELLERSYEVLHQTRLALPRLERVERISEKEWAKDIQRCVSAIPSAPVSLMMDDGPFFRMAAPGFSAPVPPLVGLPPTVAGTSFWLNEIILLTALSVLDATRPTYADFEFRKATTRLAADRVGEGVYPTSPYPATKSQTLVLVNRRNMADRVCIVEVVEPESGLMKAFAREEEDWELGISLPRPPAGDASSAGEDSRQPPAGARTSSFPERVPTLIASDCFASPGQIFATCKENRLAHFLLTDTREFVFGEIQMAPALRRNFDDPLGISSVGRGRVVGVETGAQTTADFGQAGPRGSDGVLLVKFRPLACFANDSPVGFLQPLHFTQPVLESLVYFLTRAFDTTREERAIGIDLWATPPPVPAKNRC